MKRTIETFEIIGKELKLTKKIEVFNDVNFIWIISR
jgi:hypothetical protein